MGRNNIKKFPALRAAKNKLKAYFKKYNLNPQLSYSNDPIHGEAIREMVKVLNVERAKVLDVYNEFSKETTIKKFVKLKLNKAKMAIKKKEKKVEKPVKESKEKAPKKVEKKASVKPSKYDYPLIDGREMTKDEKKKYRAAQRKEIQKDSKPKKDKALKKVETPSEDKKTSKKKKATKPVPEKPLKKAKSKKAVKDED